MKQPNLILVIGMPATGKTHLSKRISKELNMPLYAKDEIKECIFDGLGWSDVEWSKKVGMTTFSLMDYIIEQQLASGHGLIIETTYNPKFENEKYQVWQDKYNFRCVQVLCYADSNVSLQRFKERVRTGGRHPGHIDEIRSLDYSKQYGELGLPLDVSGEVIRVDTTDFSAIDLSKITKQIKSYFSPGL